MLHLAQVMLHIIFHFIEATGERDTPLHSSHADRTAPAQNHSTAPRDGPRVTGGVTLDPAVRWKSHCAIFCR